MFHYFSWKIVDFPGFKILKNKDFWIKITYSGIKTEWDFFLHPIIDQNHSTIYYLAFDSERQLDLFYLLLKISWIGPKTANFIVTWFDIEDIQKAIDTNDLNFFKQISWIGPKTAKKILIELKDKINISDIENFEKDEKLKNDIIRAVCSLWYSKQKVENFLKNYKWDFSDKQKIIQDIVKSL